MSRNLTTSYCCENLVKLEDLVGKPIEFRRYSSEAPFMGTRWDCPTCGTAYFAFWRRGDTYWADSQLKSGEWKEESLAMPGGRDLPNPNAGRFAVEKDGRVEQTGYFVIDLSYYESFNDECNPDLMEAVDRGDMDPAFLCTGDCDEVQWAWGSPCAPEPEEGLLDLMED